MAKKRVINLALLIAVAKELQDLCDFDPAIKTKGKTEEELKKSITEAASQLGPDDEVSQDAIAVFTELGIEIGAEAPEEEEEEAEEPEAEEEEAEEEGDDAPPVKAKKAAAPAKKAAAPKAKPEGASTKLSTVEKIEFFSPLIESGKYTTKELVERSLEKFPGLSESSVRTFLVDSKNAKYNKFPKLVVADAEGKLNFAAAAKKK